MKDPYKDVFDAIAKALNANIKMIVWIAEHTLSVNDYKEFIDEFSQKPDKTDDGIMSVMEYNKSIKEHTHEQV